MKHLLFGSILVLLAVMCVPGFGIVRQYRIYATDGYVTMSDQSVKYVFGFNDTGVKGQVQLPAPLIWGQVGDEIRVSLTNLGFKYRSDLTDPHTIHLHGLHLLPYYDGFPESSFGVPENATFTYKFKAHHEGTFMYHCHVEAVEHVQMGMYGPMVIYKNSGKTIYGKSYAKEYIWMVSEFDSRWHKAMEPGAEELDIPEILQSDPPQNYAEWVRVNFRPDYWLVNGMGFPDTARTAADLPLITHDPADNTFIAGIQNGIFVANGQAAHAGLQKSALIDTVADEQNLVRFIHMGYQAHPYHLHGTDYEIIGSDGAPLPNVTFNSFLAKLGCSGASYNKFTMLIGSGETWDTLIKFDKKILQANNALVPKDQFGNDIVPFADPDVIGDLYEPQANGYWYWPAHCHDDYHVADAGVYPSGMLTLVRVKKLPPAP